MIVFFTGISSVAFLFAEGRPVPALIALVLSGAFVVLIAMLVPSLSVTLHDMQNNVVLTLSQQSNISFPTATFLIATPDRRVLARIERTTWSRLGRNRWVILSPEHDRAIGFAAEDSLSRALVRKVAGKFSPRLQTDIRIHYLGHDVGRIIRRPDSKGDMDVLEVSGEIDKRIAVGLALLVLGSEP